MVWVPVQAIIRCHTDSYEAQRLPIEDEEFFRLISSRNSTGLLLRCKSWLPDSPPSSSLRLFSLTSI